LLISECAASRLPDLDPGGESKFEEGGEMSSDKSDKGIKEKAAHEFKEMAIVTVYLAFFFCALATYSMLLMEKSELAYFTYGVAVVNALVVAKVLLIGEAAHLGKRYEAKPLIYSCVYKAFLYTLLVFAFHFVEEIIKRLIHGKDIAGAFRDIRLDELLARSVVIFCTFIPFFAFRELGRVLGLDKFRAMLIGKGGSANI
jgi:hypothetical protein